MGHWLGCGALRIGGRCNCPLQVLERISAQSGKHRFPYSRGMEMAVLHRGYEGRHRA